MTTLATTRSLQVETARTPLCRLEEVPADGLKEVRLNADTRICLANAGGTLYACQGSCPHQGVALCEGALDGTMLTCLEHLWQWDLQTGSPQGLADQPLKTFAIEVVDGLVYLKD